MSAPGLASASPECSNHPTAKPSRWGGAPADGPAIEPPATIARQAPACRAAQRSPPPVTISRWRQRRRPVRQYRSRSGSFRERQPARDRTALIQLRLADLGASVAGSGGAAARPSGRSWPGLAGALAAGAGPGRAPAGPPCLRTAGGWGCRSGGSRLIGLGDGPRIRTGTDRSRTPALVRRSLSGVSGHWGHRMPSLTPGVPGHHHVLRHDLCSVPGASKSRGVKTDDSLLAGSFFPSDGPCDRGTPRRRCLPAGRSPRIAWTGQHRRG